MSRTIVAGSAGLEYTDAQGVHRYGSVQALPYVSVLCLANGHNWNDPPCIHGQSDFRCERGCGREKTEVQDRTGVVQKADYRGGHMLAPQARVLRCEARAELRRRKEAAARDDQARADADADLELRAALEEHQVALNGSAR